MRVTKIRFFSYLRFLIIFFVFLSACSQIQNIGNDQSVQPNDQLAFDDAVDAEEFESIEPLAVKTDEDLLAQKDLPHLIDYSIQSISSESNILLAKIEQKPIFSLSKSAPSEYVLTIQNTSLAPALDPVLVAPKGAGKIRSVRSVQSGDNLRIRIFSEPDAILRAENDGDKLIVAAFADHVNWDEVRAQADFEDLEGEEEVGLEESPSEEDYSEEDEIAGEIEDLEEELDDLFETQYTGRLISLDLQDTDIDNALRIIAEVSNLNIIASDDVTGKVTLRLIDVPWDQALDVILKTNGLDMVREGNVVRIAPVEKLRAEREALKQAQQAEEELEPLKVHYVRISYAKAADLQPLVESVLSERGSVTFDERTNQLIIKDITKGLKNVRKLVQKLDLRTPQVLIESQIVEASRSFSRRLGSQLGFSFLRTPETGNALGYNFPNTFEAGGSALDSEGNANGNVSEFANGESTALSFLFGSADGTKNLNLRLSQAESEGIARVVSRPSVAVTNNTPAVIKSVQKLRIKLPTGGGVNIGVGAGAAGGGGGNVATETIEIGIVLNVTAQASPDYFVLLDIDAKSSSLGNAEDAVDGIPPEIERSATSSVLVSSGQTFAMGGIYRVDENNDVQGMPFIKDIPVLGHFFRSSTVRDADQELLFFLTPRIIEGSFDDAAMRASS